MLFPAIFGKIKTKNGFFQEAQAESGKEIKMKLETAIQRCFDRCNLDPKGDGMDIYKYMCQYKTIRELPEEQFEQVYEQISDRLGFRR